MDIMQLLDLFIYIIFIIFAIYIWIIRPNLSRYSCLRQIPDISNDTLKKILYVFLGIGIKWEIDVIMNREIINIILVTCAILLIIIILFTIDRIEAKRKRKENASFDNRIKQIVKDGLREHDEEKK
jgi:hypothetical protein